MRFLRASVAWVPALTPTSSSRWDRIYRAQHPYTLMATGSFFSLCSASSSTSSLEDVLQNLGPHSVLVLDGGIGEELMRQGLPDDRKTWSAKALSDPAYHDLLRRVHASFLRAGARIVTTNSYGVVPGVGFSDDEIAKFGQIAGQIARQACQEHVKGSSAESPCFVLGSLGPLRESYRPDLIVQNHMQGVHEYSTMVRALDPNVDAFVAETMSCVAEATQAVEAVQRHTSSPGRSCWVSFTLNSTGHLRDGTPVSQGIPALLDFARSIGTKVPVVMFNCCEPEAIDLALNELKSHNMLPDPRPRDAVMSRADADATGGAVRWGACANRLTAVTPDWTMASSDTPQPLRTDVSPERYARSFAQRWIQDYGVSVVGGCCGITPEHIAMLSATLTGGRGDDKGTSASEGANRPT